MKMIFHFFQIILQIIHTGPLNRWVSRSLFGMILLNIYLKNLTKKNIWCDVGSYCYKHYMPQQLNPPREQQEEKGRDKYFTYYIFSPYRFCTDGKQNLIQNKIVIPLRSIRGGREGDVRLGGETVTVSKQLLHSPDSVCGSLKIHDTCCSTIRCRSRLCLH